MSWLNAIVLKTLPLAPRFLVRRLAMRYIAGERLEDALARLASLRDRGYPGILDLLGEGVTHDGEADEAASKYIEAMRAAHGERLDVYISVKPSHLGLALSEEQCLRRYAKLARECREIGARLRVEMEEASTVDATLRIYRSLRSEFDNVGVVLQARLFRTLDDIARLSDAPLDVRIVKGIYLEPPEIAHTGFGEIRDAFVACVDRLCTVGATLHVATHDEELADRCLEVIRRRGLPPDRWEFQVLLGVRERLWARWKGEGHPVRVYVPFGPRWLAYSLRRFRENPQILGYVIRDTLGFGG